MKSEKNNKDNTQIKNTVFVSGITYTSTQEEVLEFFQECGEIT